MTSAMAAAPLRLSASLWLLLLCAAGSASAQSPSTAPSPPTAAPYMYPTPGFDDLSAWNRVAMIATILVFFVLSVLSGRELWRLVYGSRMGTSTNAAASGGAGAGSGAAAQQQKGLSSFITPRQGATPSAPLHSTGSAVGVSASAGLLADESAHAMSTGAEMRLRFFVLLFLASTIRVVALVVEITTLRVMEASPARSLYARLLSMFLWLPALLFVSMYGLVLLFWAQLCYACWGKAYPWPRRVFFAFNVMLYVLFLVLLAVNATSGGFWRACDIMLGAVYLIGLIGILYYSVRLIQFFSLHGPDDDFFFDLATTAGTPPPASPRQIVLRRISAVCALLSVLFVVKASYLIGLGLGFVPSEETAQYRSPVGVHHLVFEFSMHFFTEFVPCSLLLFFTRKSTRTRLTPTAAQTSVTPGSSTLTLPPGGGGLPLHFGLRGRNNSAHSAYQDDTHSVGSGSLTGYQFQTMQRTYGATLTTALRTGSTPATYQSVDNATTTAPSTAASTSYV